jgi:hypothetical protein
MAKGFFTQGLAVLLTRQVTLEEVCRCLTGFDVVKRLEASDNPEFSGPSAIVACKPEQNGCASIDLYPAQWPDHMGHPQEEPILFATWSMGHFGPYAYPSGLKRAAQQAWRWGDAQTEVLRHVAAVRLRMSYIFGAGKDAPVLPQNYDARDELIFLTKLASALSGLEGSLCYFNPNGEVLLPFSKLAESLQFHATHGLPPLDVWANVRLFNLDASWSVMDSVGNWQLDTPDHEVAFPRELITAQQVDHFIRNATLYMLSNGDVIKDGDTMDGPANRSWQAMRRENGLSDPPREVLRWLPCDVPGIPNALLADGREPAIKKKPFWKLW